jgi:hypothetical protein
VVTRAKGLSSSADRNRVYVLRLKVRAARLCRQVETAALQSAVAAGGAAAVDALVYRLIHSCGSTVRPRNR